MNSTPSTEWIWWIAGGTGLLLSIGLLYWSLLHCRSRGRRRCPKCWYDMSHAPKGSRTCSECGHTARNEKKLFKTRRRKPWAVVAMFVLLIGWGTCCWPRTEVEGWRGFVPTTALVLALPWLEVGDEIAAPAQSGLTAGLPIGAGSGFGGTTIAPQVAIRKRSGPLAVLDRLFPDDGEDTAWRLLCKRARDDRMWNWQWDLLVSRSVNGDAGREPPQAAWVAHYGPLLLAADSHGKLGSFEQRAKSRYLEAVLLESSRHTVVLTSPQPNLVSLLPRASQPRIRGMMFAVDVNVLCDGKLILHCDLLCEPLVWPRSQHSLPLEWVIDPADREGLMDGEWTLQLISNPAVAMGDSDCELYWEGEIELPLEVVVVTGWRE